MRERYQGGYLRHGLRKTGPMRWEFLWWDTESTGRRVRRKAVIGTVQQYPNLEDAWQASNGLRVSINEARNRQREQSISVADLIAHYIQTELASDRARSRKIARHESRLQRLPLKVGKACLGKSKYPCRSHGCR